MKNPEQTKTPSVPPSYFEEIYIRNKDPWNYQWTSNALSAWRSRFYEQRKYWRTLRAIPKRHYRNALEIGCSIGVFTKRLARRCERLLAIDYSAAALKHAQDRCQHMPHVRFEHRAVPGEFPLGPFDLILFSEVGYYLSEDDFLQTTVRIVAELVSDGVLVMVHYRRHTDVPLGGDAPHDLFLRETAGTLEHLRDLRNENYRLDVFRKPK